MLLWVLDFLGFGVGGINLGSASGIKCEGALHGLPCSVHCLSLGGTGSFALGTLPLIDRFSECLLM